MCESCCFFSLVSHYIEFVIVYRVDRRTFIFFSRDSISDFHCESLVLFIFYVICLDLSRSNERELDRLFYFAFSSNSLDLLWIYLNRLINVQLPLDMRFIKWSKAGFDQWKRPIRGCVSGQSNKTFYTLIFSVRLVIILLFLVNFQNIIKGVRTPIMQGLTHILE